MQNAHERNEFQIYLLGVVLHALSLNATLLTVAVIDSVVFDSLFREATHMNAEGTVVVRRDGDGERRELLFDEVTVNHFLHTEPLVSSTPLVCDRLTVTGTSGVPSPTGRSPIMCGAQRHTECC